MPNFWERMKTVFNRKPSPKPEIAAYLHPTKGWKKRKFAASNKARLAMGDDFRIYDLKTKQAVRQ